MRFQRKSREKKPEPETFGAFEDIAPTDPRLAKLDEKWIALGFEGKGILENYAGDRSRAVMAFACECVRANIVDKVIASCLMKWEIGRHIREQGNVERALHRTITRAHEFIANSPLFKMNEQHAVLPIGGKTRVATWGEDPDFPATRPLRGSRRSTTSRRCTTSTASAFSARTRRERGDHHGGTRLVVDRTSGTAAI